MARLVGVGLPHEKRMEIALTYIYGIGHTRTKGILESTGVSPNTRVRDLTEDELIKLRDFIQANYKVEGDLRREVAVDIHRKTKISCYQGRRHRAGFPVHDQHTRADTRTCREPRRTVTGKRRAK